VMLSRPQDFAALQAGAVRSHPLLTIRFLRTDLETTRFGLATGRKLGGAVVRNRVGSGRCSGRWRPRSSPAGTS
jgi:ribonuclease P protein component